MKKALIVVAAIVGSLGLIFWIATWFRADEAVATSASRPWPGGMGTLDSLERVERQANEAAVKLKALADALPQENEAVTRFVEGEMTRNELMIEQPPAIPDVTSIRELLLDGPVVWAHRYEIGDSATSANRGAQMTVARALIASALAKARAGDPAAWEDLRAVWNLARSLDGQPQMMEQTAALSMVRMINAVAWKMPLPAPEWLGDLQQRDMLPQLLRAYQHQTASYWEDGARMFPTKWLADSVEHDRQIAETLFNLTSCDVDVPMNKLATDLRSVWRRAFRYRAEREATANALRIREGKPIETTSRCSDGEWAFDGTTLRFSREIATPSPDAPMPLVLRVAQP